MIREKSQCEAARKEKELIKQFREKDTHQIWKAKGHWREGHTTRVHFEPKQWELHLRIQSVNGNWMEEDLLNILPEIMPFGPLTEGDTKLITPISEQQIWETMRWAKEKATGLDEIPLRGLKKANEVCIPVLTVIFSQIFFYCPAGQ